MNELVSIIVPVYNTENFLAETIESVLAQSYSEWELLLIDDGSTDSSADICKKYAKQDERIFYHYKTNGGQASARNLGIKQSNGQWIAFLDSDDLWLPKKLELQFESIQKYQPDFLYGLGYFYHPYKENKLETYDWVTGLTTGSDFFQVLYSSCSVNTNTVLVKKSLFDRVGFFLEDETVRGTEDWEMWMRIAKSVKTIYGSPSREVYYRIHPGGIHFQHAKMLKGKAFIYSLYDTDKAICRQLKLRQYRYTYRELINYLWKEMQSSEIKLQFSELAKKDRIGLGTLTQSVLIKVLPMKAFMWVSQKIIYRIAYRLEQLIYVLFIKK
ncbi:MAG: glycosyltransferase family 2 protein [Putridiphycobacter sp.]|nr:glycosyltransferase family 2 protein [Putridiphycobacter sp.]